MADMEKRRLGRTDVMVSELCLGTMVFGQQADEPTAHRLMDHAVANGINFIDTAEKYPVPQTAQTYGRTEEVIGGWLKARGRRDDIILATKIAGRQSQLYVRPDMQVNGEVRIDKRNIEAAIDASLKRLQTEYVDLYQLHSPDRKIQAWGRTTFSDPGDADETPIVEHLVASHFGQPDRMLQDQLRARAIDEGEPVIPARLDVEPFEVHRRPWLQVQELDEIIQDQQAIVVFGMTAEPTGFCHQVRGPGAVRTRQLRSQVDLAGTPERLGHERTHPQLLTGCADDAHTPPKDEEIVERRKLHLGGCDATPGVEQVRPQDEHTGHSGFGDHGVLDGLGRHAQLNQPGARVQQGSAPREDRGRKGPGFASHTSPPDQR